MTTADQRLSNALDALEAYNEEFSDKIATLSTAVTTTVSKAEEAAGSATVAENAAANAQAIQLGNITDGAITGEKLADGAITVDKIADGVIPDADTTTKGLVELATTVEAEAGVSTEHAVTPQGVVAAIVANAPFQATDSVSGVTRYATDSEVENRVDVDAALRPSHLLAVPSITAGEGWLIIGEVQYCWGKIFSRGTFTFPLAFKEGTTPIVALGGSWRTISLWTSGHYQTAMIDPDGASNTRVTIGSHYSDNSIDVIAIGEPE